MTTPTMIATWLNRQPTVIDPKPFKITIGRGSWPAARYRQVCNTVPGSAAHRRGEHQYERETIYLVGPLPSRYRRSSRVAFRVPSDTRDWYVTAYYPHDEPNEFHPFGRSFMLGPWDGFLTDTTIDQYEPTPYQRMRINAEPA